MSYLLPVSVKGIIIHQDQVILLKNERQEWELPGGRLEKGETPEEAVRREIEEELGLTCAVDSLVDVWVYEVVTGKEVLIVTYLCRCDSLAVVISDEHLDYKWFPLSEVEHLRMPAGYKNSINKVNKNHVM